MVEVKAPRLTRAARIYLRKRKKARERAARIKRLCARRDMLKEIIHAWEIAGERAAVVRCTRQLRTVEQQIRYISSS
jgi:hypothetical protein